MWSPIAWAKASDAMRWTHLSLYSLATYPPIAGSIVGLGAMLAVSVLIVSSLLPPDTPPPIEKLLSL